MGAKGKNIDQQSDIQWILLCLATKGTFFSASHPHSVDFIVMEIPRRSNFSVHKNFDSREGRGFHLGAGHFEEPLIALNV